ncbi:MAG TPA: HAD family hydrolase [Solirubrobacterales bacterium]|nr:HAD family hydrolase [Solirubrobacterales bacterium]
MPLLEAVTFDFWNTIAQVAPEAMPRARRRAILAACEACEVELEEELLAAGLERVRVAWERSWASGEHLAPAAGAEMLVATLGVEGRAGEMVAEAFLGVSREVEFEWSAGIGECLEELAGRGVRIGIVCDVGFTSGVLLREVLEREGLLGHFGGWSFSDETGHYKPAPQAFEAALASLGTAPRRALHIGDLRRTDVAGAAALGMRTVRYTGMHADADEAAAVEAEFVIDDLRELPALVQGLGAAPG